jgi:uncharacterized protein YndB with AHSA1/START domain
MTDTTAIDSTAMAPVVKTVTVKASVDKAFRVFTTGMDSWWPRTHHIGKAPMKRTIIEERVGGRCYSEQTDDTECDWGEVLAWEPPSRFVMAWKITPQWGYEPDLTKASEVEVRFAELAPGLTQVILEHKYFERMGEGALAMRTMVDGQMGWGELLVMFGSSAEAE